MNKLLLIAIIGVFLVGTIGAVTMAGTFDKKVKEVDPTQMCEKIKEKPTTKDYDKYKDKKCDELEKVKTDEEFITQNDKGVYMIN